MKKLLIIMVAVLSVFPGVAQKTNLHSFKTETIDGIPFDLASLKGKKVMIVNTASKCGLTPQYEKLQEVYKKYGGDKFVIIAFPSNDFLGQEPGSNAQIKEFCSVNYGVTFPVMTKIKVIEDDMHPIYKWLTSKELNGKFDAPVKWNFQKFLIDENGNLVKMLPPKTSPDDEEIINWITK